MYNFIGPPSSVTLSYQQSVLTGGESTVVECTAIGGEPREAINLTLWRGDELLAQVSGDHLNYSTESYAHGAYRCAVGSIHNTSILHERGKPFSKISVYILVATGMKAKAKVIITLHFSIHCIDDWHFVYVVSVHAAHFQMLFEGIDSAQCGDLRVNIVDNQL